VCVYSVASELLFELSRCTCQYCCKLVLEQLTSCAVMALVTTEFFLKMFHETVILLCSLTCTTSHYVMKSVWSENAMAQVRHVHTDGWTAPKRAPSTLCWMGRGMKMCRKHSLLQHLSNGFNLHSGTRKVNQSG